MAGSDVPRVADFVVVGAGIIGLSIAYQLARRGAGRVIVLDKGAGVAEGSTGASSACIRQRYTHSELIRLARDGLAAYSHWSEFTRLREPRAVYQRTGVLWMIGQSADRVNEECDQLVSHGALATCLDAAGVRKRFPALSTCGAAFAAMADHEHECVEHDAYLFEEEGGYSDPVGANQDLLDAARREGAEVRFRCAVTAIRSRGGRVRSVDLVDGIKIDTPVVINAAGPWCNQLNALAGLELSWVLRPTRVQVFFREWPSQVPGPLPLVADAASGIYFRPESRAQQILLGSIREEDEKDEVDDPDHFDRSGDREFQDRVIFGLHHRIPALPYRGRITSVAGLYTVNSDDVHPIIGVTELAGYVVANGFSGHGFKLAPMVGSMVAQCLTGKRADFDTDVPIEFFSVDREPLSVRAKSVLA